MQAPWIAWMFLPQQLLAGEGAEVYLDGPTDISAHTHTQRHRETQRDTERHRITESALLQKQVSTA